jgi:hypothetical protein
MTRFGCTGLPHFPAILKIIRKSLMLKNIEPALTFRDVTAFHNLRKTIYRLVKKGVLYGLKVANSMIFLQIYE